MIIIRIFFFLFLSLPSVAMIQVNLDNVLLSSEDSTLSFSMLSGPSGRKVYIGKNKGSQLPRGYQGHARYYVQLYPQKSSARCIFLHLGMGGLPTDQAAKYFAKLLHSFGYHVVVMGSSFTEEFGALVGSSPYLGQASREAADIYQVMKVVKQKIEQRLAVQDYAMVGYSYGALMTAHLLNINDDKQLFSFTKVALINPPVDLLYGLRKLDEFSSKFKKLNFLQALGTLLRFNSYQNQVKDYGFPLYKNKALLKGSLLKRNRAQALISISFNDSLSQVVFHSQQDSPLNVFDTDNDIRRQQASRISFYDYLTEFMGAYFQNTLQGRQEYRAFYGDRPYNIGDLNYYNSLYPTLTNLSIKQNVILFHNRDDFLLRGFDLDYLNFFLGDRLIVFNKGGHVGNIWHPQFQAQLKMRLAE